uniref:Uncharacterized protein n=1 Tax=Anguilla anguilla TaxID=7936 RepID=A0A0E9UPP4_ANGAN
MSNVREVKMEKALFSPRITLQGNSS